MLFSSSSHIGIALGQAEVQVVLADKTRTSFTLRDHLEEKLGAEGWTAENLGRTFASLKKSMSLWANKEVTLCLPPQAVYLTSVRVPKSSGEDAVRRALASVLPEMVDDLTIVSSELAEHEGDSLFAVAAVRTDTITACRTAAKKANIRLSSIVPASCALASLQAAVPTSLIVHFPVSKGDTGAVTLMHQKWPIDEAVVSSDKECCEEVANFLQEYSASDISTVMVIGTAAQSKLLAKIIPDSLHVVSSADLFPEFDDSILPWVTAVAGSLLKEKPVIEFA